MLIDDTKKKMSNTLYIMKFFAILSVIAAHVNEVDYSNKLNYCITSAWKIFGVVGVIIFFILGGYFYKREKNDTKIFWKKKFKTIIIPWFVASVITYAVHNIKHMDWNLLGYFKWFVGSGTFFYYLTNYCLFLLLFKFIYKKNIYLIICCLLTLIQAVLNTFGIYNVGGIITHYLNIFNWIGFFSFGILMKKYNLLEKIIKFKFKFLFSILSLVLMAMLMYFNIIGYFHILSFIFELVSFFTIFIVSYNINSKILVYIGKISFPIYLYHMQILQFILLKLFGKNLLLLIFNPIIGLSIMAFSIYIYEIVFKRTNYKKYIDTIIGLR